VSRLKGKKGASRPLGGKEASAGWAFQIEDNALEVRLIENLLALGGTEEESVATEIVDAADHAVDVIVDAADEAVAEWDTLEASHPQVPFDAPGALLLVTAALSWEVVAIFRVVFGLWTLFLQAIA
jgi:hypothetical protein